MADRGNTSCPPRIVVAEPYSPDAMARLHCAGQVIDLSGAARETLLASVADAEALLVRSYVMVDQALLNAAPNLRVVGRGGAGIENIDTVATRQRGVTVVYTPQAATHAVAEHTLALMMTLLHRVCAADTAVRRGDFAEFRGEVIFPELSECILGVVGMGRIGSQVARICARGFGMQVLYNDIAQVGPFNFPAESAQKPELFAKCHVVTLHVPLTQATRRMIDAVALERFQPHSVLINTSRGAVVDLSALATALSTRRIAGAALDVFDPEPPPADHPIMSAPNVVLTPHMAARSGPGLARMNDVVDDVIAVLQGRPVRFAAD